jgi:hypothetical protein
MELHEENMSVFRKKGDIYQESPLNLKMQRPNYF